MKKFLIILLVIPFLSMTTKNDETKFIGKWIGKDKNDIGYLNFDDEGYANFEIHGRIIGGKEFIQNGKKGSMTYEINSTKKPIEVDLIVTLTKAKNKKNYFVSQILLITTQWSLLLVLKAQDQLHLILKI
ncbi:hypothetical protein [Neotamlana laminarinivorans]|uniref:DUF2147 domain-containing protein n=1 Tax=Neotamlana laminarinivorans TaxID=2883124 RepID=A0A9X1I2C5_9FLAO|nr:hypothetical protein [Tamlana laminarinivorans]MCB4798684.1 hypothetical protein [Tamlana laminarinivorans]